MTPHMAVAGVGVIAMTLLAPQNLSAQASSQQTSRIDGENRLFVRFVEDAAIVPSYWLEGQVGYRSNDAAFGDGSRAASEAASC